VLSVTSPFTAPVYTEVAGEIQQRGDAMKKILTGVVVAAAVGAAAVGMSSTAEAHRFGPHWGWGPGPFIAGAVVGGAVAAAATAPYYYAPYGPYYGPVCRRVWNGYYWVPAC
jgi:hypothetical protein